MLPNSLTFAFEVRTQVAIFSPRRLPNILTYSRSAALRFAITDNWLVIHGDEDNSLEILTLSQVRIQCADRSPPGTAHLFGRSPGTTHL